MVLSLSLLMDILVLSALGVTIFYAYRLSRSLDNFRRYRQDFSLVIQELSTNIESAQDAIEALKEASVKAGQDLHKSVREATHLADELELMNKSGNSLAERLEGLAEKNRRIAQGLGRDEDEDSESGEARSGMIDNVGTMNFFIQDRDFGEAVAETHEFLSDDDEEDIMPSELQSRAEKELFEALQGKKRAG